MFTSGWERDTEAVAGAATEEDTVSSLPTGVSWPLENWSPSEYALPTAPAVLVPPLTLPLEFPPLMLAPGVVVPPHEEPGGPRMS